MSRQERMPDLQWIDISVPLHDSMVHWPGDAPFKIERVSDVNSGDSNTLSTVTTGTHAGTHIDAPAHFIRGGPGIDRMPPDVGIGPARVIEIKDRESIKPEELEEHSIRRGDRLLFKTHNSSRAWRNDRFVKDYVYLTKESAAYLADRRVKAVGIDYLSIGGFKADGASVHRILLGAGIWIIEGLNLAEIDPGRFDLVCLPLRLAGADGSPARAFLRPRRR